MAMWMGSWSWRELGASSREPDEQSSSMPERRGVGECGWWIALLGFDLQRQHRKRASLSGRRRSRKPGFWRWVKPVEPPKASAWVLERQSERQTIRVVASHRGPASGALREAMLHLHTQKLERIEKIQASASPTIKVIASTLEPRRAASDHRRPQATGLPGGAPRRSERHDDRLPTAGLGLFSEQGISIQRLIADNAPIAPCPSTMR